MTEDQVKQIVIDIINEIAPDEDTSNLKGEVSLRDQMDLDSMDFHFSIESDAIRAVFFRSSGFNTIGMEHTLEILAERLLPHFHQSESEKTKA